MPSPSCAGRWRQAYRIAKLRPAFARAALAHYAQFGHCAIYALKTGELIQRLDADAAEPLLLALTRSLVRGWREEKLPEFRFYARALTAWKDGGNEPLCSEDLVRLNVDSILKRLLQSARRPVHEIYDALMGAAAWNLLHFDLAFDRATDNAIADNIGWLDFTHALTFANACRALVRGDAGSVAASAVADGAVRGPQREICERRR